MSFLDATPLGIHTYIPTKYDQKIPRSIVIMERKRMCLQMDGRAVAIMMAIFPEHIRSVDIKGKTLIIFRVNDTPCRGQRCQNDFYLPWKQGSTLTFGGNCFLYA